MICLQSIIFFEGHIHHPCQQLMASSEFKKLTNKSNHHWYCSQLPLSYTCRILKIILMFQFSSWQSVPFLLSWKLPNLFHRCHHRNWNLFPWSSSSKSWRLVPSFSFYNNHHWLSKLYLRSLELVQNLNNFNQDDKNYFFIPVLKTF